MTVDENKALVSRMEEAAFRDYQTYVECAHEDYVVYGGSSGRWPTRWSAKEDAGPEWRSEFEEYAKAHPTFRIIIDDIIGEGDKVAIRATWLEEGKPIANAMAFYRIADGKIMEDWFCTTEIDQ
jgi:hypothetical protein